MTKRLVSRVRLHGIGRSVAARLWESDLRSKLATRLRVADEDVVVRLVRPDVASRVSVRRAPGDVKVKVTDRGTVLVAVLPSAMTKAADQVAQGLARGIEKNPTIASLLRRAARPASG